MPQWMKAGQEKKWWKELAAGDVAVLDQSVAAGEVVAHFGEAGKAGAWTGQVHFEIFSEEEIGEKIQPGYWTVVDGSRGGRFCVEPQIVGPIDTNKSQTLAHSEVVNFFHKNPARDKFRKLAVKHLSEWGDKNDWEVALNKAKDFAGLTKGAKHKLFTDQIEPFLWWGDGLESLGLPSEKIIWGYHPITFVLWLHDQMKGKATAAKDIKDAAAWGGKKPPAEIKDDSADGAECFMDDEDALFGEAAKSLDLEKLSNGYPDEK
jgi:hypothetical protein